MTNDRRPQSWTNLRMMKAIGAGLQQKLPGATLEPIPDELLSLLAEAEQRQGPSGLSQPQNKPQPPKQTGNSGQT